MNVVLACYVKIPKEDTTALAPLGLKHLEANLLAPVGAIVCICCMVVITNTCVLLYVVVLSLIPCAWIIFGCDWSVFSSTSSSRDIDINECLDYSTSPCPHRCVNTYGSFECICPPGLLYLPDRKSCVGLIRSSNYGQSGQTSSRRRYTTRSRRSAFGTVVVSQWCRRGYRESEIDEKCKG